MRFAKGSMPFEMRWLSSARPRWLPRASAKTGRGRRSGRKEYDIESFTALNVAAIDSELAGKVEL